jgi:type VI secretion system protein ImpA
MPEPSPLDVSEYLVPIAEGNPSGDSMRYEDEYAAIERAREEEPDSPGDDRWKKRKPKKADWEAVIALGLKALKEKTKDVEIAAWVAEALARRRGLAGLRDGLRLILAIQDTFWETAHPSEGDLELREGVYEFLDNEKRLPLLIKGTPLVEVDGLPGYSLLTYNEAIAIKSLQNKKTEEADAAVAALLADGRIVPEDFDQAVKATDRSFYVATVALLDECIEAANRLNRSIAAPEHYGKQKRRQYPALTTTVAALEDVAKLANQLLERMPVPEPAPAEPSVEPEPPWPTEDDSVDDDPTVDEAQPSWESVDPPVDERRAPARIRPAARPASGVGPISGPADARSWIVAAARSLREADANDPLPYLVVRSLAMGGLYRSSSLADPSKFPPPTSEDRQVLRRLAGEGSWPELLERAELILARDEGTGWLDARRLAIKALGELGLADAGRAARAILAAELRDYPHWPRSELDDGTPCAGAETLAWIEQTFPADSDAGHHSPVPVFSPPTSFADRESAAGASDGELPQDPWDQAQALHGEGRVQEAISLLGRAAREAHTGRDRFLRTLQQAELCLMIGRPGVATPLLEGLARQIDELQLDRWEDPALCARVVASLYRCVRDKDQARARAIYDRLCQLDICQALSLGEGKDA